MVKTQGKWGIGGEKQAGQLRAGLVPHYRKWPAAKRPPAPFNLQPAARLSSLNAIEPLHLDVGGEEAPGVSVQERAALGGLALRRQADSSSRVLSEPGSESLPTPRPSLNAPETDRSNSALSGPGSENLRTSRWSGYKFSSDSESLRTSLPSGYNDPDVVSKSSACRCLRQLTP
jgi:hypothetical protein